MKESLSFAAHCCSRFASAKRSGIGVADYASGERKRNKFKKRKGGLVLVYSLIPQLAHTMAGVRTNLIMLILRLLGDGTTRKENMMMCTANPLDVIDHKIARGKIFLGKCRVLLF